jgi:hypothetical protein
VILDEKESRKKGLAFWVNFRDVFWLIGRIFHADFDLRPWQIRHALSLQAPAEGVLYGKALRVGKPLARASVS